MFLLAVGHIFQAVAINNDRITHLVNIQSQIQQRVNDIAKAAQGSSLQQLQTELTDLNSKRDDLNGKMLYGSGEKLSFTQCFLPVNPACFHRNSSEQNNLWVAMGSGALGVILFLLRGFRTVASDNRPQEPSTLLSVVCLVPTGMIVGLLTIFLLRGTKGALLTPVADVVQVENPYGIAFACSVAAMFSDQIIAWLSKLVGALPARGPQQSEPG